MRTGLIVKEAKLFKIKRYNYYILLWQIVKKPKPFFILGIGLAYALLFVPIWPKKNKNNYFTSQLSLDDSFDESLNNNKIFDGVLPSEQELSEQIARGENPYLVFVAQAIERAKFLLTQNPTLYTEIHHIVPRHEGGLDEPDNLARLTYNDHAVAHYIRWIVYKNENDRIAYQVMIGQSVDLRRERARLGGLKGGPIAQAQFKEQSVGWYNSEGQSARGKKGAAKNKEQGTGAYNPANLQKANDALNLAKAQNPGKYAEQAKKNLAAGLQTQKEKGINIGDPLSQRRKSLMYRGVVLNGVRYFCDTEQRTYICETSFEYYLQHAPKK